MADFERKRRLVSVNEVGGLPSDQALLDEVRAGRGLPESAFWADLCTALRTHNGVGVEAALRNLERCLTRRSTEELSLVDAYPLDDRRCPEPAAAAQWAAYKSAVGRRAWGQAQTCLATLRVELRAHLPTTAVDWR